MRLLTWTAAILLTGLTGLSLGCDPVDPGLPPEASCTNGKDDNGDGHTDCEDATCRENAACVQTDGGDQRKPCTEQSTCLVGSYRTSWPLSQCNALFCATPELGIEVAIKLNLSAFSGQPATNLKSANVRFLSKKTPEGGTVDCAAVAAKASSSTHPSQLEDSKAFNLVAWEGAYNLDNVTPGGNFTIPFVKTAVVDDFIVWVEIWSQIRDSATLLPKGLRRGWVCLDSAAPLKPEDHHQRVLTTGTFNLD